MMVDEPQKVDTCTNFRGSTPSHILKIKLWSLLVQDQEAIIALRYASDAFEAWFVSSYAVLL